jgi:hypothetical protein
VVVKTKQLASLLLKRARQYLFPHLDDVEDAVEVVEVVLPQTSAMAGKSPLHAVSSLLR